MGTHVENRDKPKTTEKRLRLHGSIKFRGTKTVSMFSKLMQQSSSFVMEGVKNLVVKKHNLPVTKIVDELMEVN